MHAYRKFTRRVRTRTCCYLLDEVRVALICIFQGLYEYSVLSC